MFALAGRTVMAWLGGVVRVSSAAAVRDDLVSLFVEGRHPFLDRGRHALPLRVDPARDASDLEEIAHLLITELHKQVGEKLPARLTDARVAERARVRFAQVSHAGRGISPDRRGRPVFE